MEMEQVLQVVLRFSFSALRVENKLFPKILMTSCTVYRKAKITETVVISTLNHLAPSGFISLLSNNLQLR